MPELPEVETVINVINPLIKDKVIDHCEVYYDRLIQSDLASFKENIKNKTILNVTRYGKYIYIHLSEDFVIITHLRMEGKFRYSKTYDARYKHTSMLYFFKDGTSLAFDDTRKFGLMYLTKEDELKDVPMIKKLGVEANKVKSEDRPNIYKKFNKKKAIKELLLDQTILCGIGNIYADETLFLSKINPFTKGNELTQLDYDHIIDNAKIVLDKAIKLGGSTIHSFHPQDGVDGRFQEELLCYGKSKLPCPNCGTLFHKEFLGGRGTTYCPNCQIDKSLEKAIAITGPIGSGKSTLLKHFEDKGYLTYSCDELIHELYQDEYIKKKMSQILGVPFDINDKNKTQLARDQMIKHIDIKKAVENYIYPILEKRMVQIIKDNDDVVFEVPTLFKAHLEYLFKLIIVIEINDENQIKNLRNRNDNVTNSKNLNKDFYYLNLPKVKILKANGVMKDLFKNADKILVDADIS